jgi:hypothetical protein
MEVSMMRLHSRPPSIATWSPDMTTRRSAASRRRQDISNRTLLALCVTAGSLSAAAVSAGDWHTVIIEAARSRPVTAPAASRVAAPARPAPSRAAPSSEQALYLVRSTITALDHANRTGNYAVLRDMAAPSFQRRNSAADLALGFSGLRNKRVDLSAVALAAPTLTVAAAGDGIMRLAGTYPLQPLAIDFDLAFEIVDGHWRLNAIAVGARPPAPPSAAAVPGQSEPRLGSPS